MTQANGRNDANNHVPRTGENYRAWLSRFDGNAGQRAEFGCTNSRVYRNADNETNRLVARQVPERV